MVLHFLLGFSTFPNLIGFPNSSTSLRVVSIIRGEFFLYTLSIKNVSSLLERSIKYRNEMRDFLIMVGCVPCNVSADQK